MDAVYEATFDLKSVHGHVLSFKKGERFLPLTSSNDDPRWILAINLNGKIGYVPVCYVHSKPVPKKELADIIEVALEAMENICNGLYTEKQRQIIQELTTWRTLLLSPVHSPSDKPISEDDKSQDGVTADDAIESKIELNHVEVVPEAFLTKDPLVVPNSSFSSTQSDLGESNSEVFFPCETPETVCSNVSVQCVVSTDDKCSGTTKKDSSNVSTQFPVNSLSSSSSEKTPNCSGNACGSCCDCDIPEWLVPKLVEKVRQSTELSHQNCKLAVAVMLDILSEGLPDRSSLWHRLKENLEKCEAAQERSENVDSEDKIKLMDIFRQLWCCKNDEQQRSWPVHEDESLILSLLTNLDAILMDADPRVTKEVVQQDDYELVDLLVTYYQMEPRRVLRVKMLQIFVTLCELDLLVVSQLLLSVLPWELANDMICTYKDEDKLKYSAFALTIIFSTAQEPPHAIYEFFQDKFLSFLCEQLEIFLRNGKELLGNHLLNILLAFNLHLKDRKPNVVFECLKTRHDARMLTEKLVFLLNREEDPVKILNHTVETPNSVLKFLVDFFSYPELVSLFYLNDIKVLLDIIVRQLTDYYPGEKIRLLYLHLVRNVLRNSGYAEHFHQKESLQKCLHTVYEHDVDCPEELPVVREILDEFSLWFAPPIPPHK